MFAKGAPALPPITSKFFILEVIEDNDKKFIAFLSEIVSNTMGMDGHSAKFLMTFYIVCVELCS